MKLRENITHFNSTPRDLTVIDTILRDEQEKPSCDEIVTWK